MPFAVPAGNTLHDSLHCMLLDSRRICLPPRICLELAPMRKFISEFAVNMVGGPHALLQQDFLASDELRAGFPDEHPCHIYLVCRRPRILITPDDVKFTDSSFEGSVTFQDGAAMKTVPFCVPWPDAAGFKFDSTYPFNAFSIVEPNGKDTSAARQRSLCQNSARSSVRISPLKFCMLANLMERTATEPPRIV